MSIGNTLASITLSADDSPQRGGAIEKYYPPPDRYKV